MIWCDIDPYMIGQITFIAYNKTAVAGIVNACGLSIYTHRGNYLNKSKLVLYKPLIHCNCHLIQL